MPERKNDCNDCIYKQGSLLHYHVFKYMVKKYGKKDQIVSAKQLREIWRRHIYNLPNAYEFHIFTEMCDYGLLKRINTQKYIFYGSTSFIKVKRRMNKFFLW